MASQPASETEARKQTSLDFLRLVVAGRIDEAYEKYADMKGRHHNAFFAAGFPALKKAMIEDHAKFPNKRFNVKHVVAEGDLVAVHGELSAGPSHPTMVVFHLHRHQAGRIVELWDCGQPVPADSPNKDGAF